jgi:hypothetical protein
VTSQELHIINTTANSGIKIRVGALKNMTIEELEASGSKTGVVFELDEIANMEKIQPNQVPQGHDRLSFKADKIMRDLAGVPQSARGFAREDVAGEAIESNQAASDVNFAGPLSNLHRSKQMLALRAQSLWQEYYTETRVLMVNRGSAYRPDIKTTTVNQTTPEGEVVNDVTRGKYSTVLVPSPSRATMSEGEFKQMVELRKLGIKVPDDVMIELSGAPNSVVQRMKGDSVQDQERQQQLAEQEQADAAALNKAKIEKESGAARLNVARAEKAESEAGRDPDAAYERVETTRIASDHATEQKRIALDREKLDVQREQGDKKIAVDLTKVKHEGMRHRETLDAQKNKPAARR